MGRTCRRGLACRFRPFESNTVSVAPETYHSGSHSKQLRWALATQVHARDQRVSRRAFGRRLEASPERAEFLQREGAIQRFGELRQTGKAISGIGLNVKHGERFRHRGIEAGTHRQCERRTEVRAQLRGRPPLAGVDQACQYVPQFLSLDLRGRTSRQTRKRSNDMQLEDQLRVVVRRPALQRGRVDAEQRSKAALLSLALLRLGRFGLRSSRCAPCVEHRPQVAAGIGQASHLAGFLACFMQCHAGDAARIVVCHLQDVARAIGSRVAIHAHPSAGRRAANGESTLATRSRIGQPDIPS
jgi:hypothetical protein